MVRIYKGGVVIRYRTSPALPCGCPLKNAQGARILTHAVTLNDGTFMCKCGRRWVRSLESGGWKELAGVKLLETRESKDR